MVSIRRLPANLVPSVALLVAACGGGGGTGVDAAGDATSVDGTTSQTLRHTVELTWIAPSTRVDDTSLALSEIGGYRIYIGTSADDLEFQAESVGAGETSASIRLLSPGTYYFAVTAYDVYGLESAFSRILSRVVR